MESYEARINKMVRDITELQINKADFKDTKGTITDVRALIFKVNQDMDSKAVRIQALEKFVDSYIPIRIQSQISETLQACLTRGFMDRLENYEVNKFKDLNL